MSTSLFSYGLICFAIGILFDLLVGVAIPRLRPIPYLFGLAGSVCLAILGVHDTTTSSPGASPYLLGVGRSNLRFDPLAGLFLTLIFVIAIAVSLSFCSWIKPTGIKIHRRGTASGYLLLLGSSAVLTCASDAFTFLFAWEMLSVSFYILTSVTRSRADQPSAAWATLGIGKVSGASLLLAFLLLAGRTQSMNLASWHSVGPGALHDVAWVLVVIGFGGKVGLVPFQVWIPIGYPAAPGPARAAMAGIAVNVGFYGLWRFLAILGRPPVWLVIALLLIGGTTAVLGVTFAGVQNRLSRVIAYSSIENAGLIVTAYAVALTGFVTGSKDLVAVGLLAATLQAVSHGFAKSAMFLSLANIEAATGTDNLDEIRGIGRTLRWSGATFSAGALTLAGLPPTIGFVSEWFILEALMQQFRLAGLALRLGLAAAGALVALTTGLSALAFLRVLGLTILGKNRAADKWPSDEAGIWGKVGMSLLGASCLLLAAASPLEIKYIASGLSPLVSNVTTLGALKSPWVLQPVFNGFSILSPTWLWVVMPSTLITVFLAALILSRGRYIKVRRVPAWHSASIGVTGPDEYSAFGFANPLRRVLGSILGTNQVTRSIEQRQLATTHPTSTHLETQTTVIEPTEQYLYRPIRRTALFIALLAKRLQNGRLNFYVAYMLFALLIALVLTAAIR